MLPHLFTSYNKGRNNYYNFEDDHCLLTASYTSLMKHLTNWQGSYHNHHFPLKETKDTRKLTEAYHHGEAKLRLKLTSFKL